MFHVEDRCSESMLAMGQFSLTQSWSLTGHSAWPSNTFCGVSESIGSGLAAFETVTKRIHADKGTRHLRGSIPVGPRFCQAGENEWGHGGSGPWGFVGARNRAKSNWLTDSGNLEFSALEGGEAVSPRHR